MVTFVITYYEQPTVMLTKCIESVLALSLRPYEREIIVVDDGSVNSPLADLKRFENDIIYMRKTNGGVSTARNFGLRAACGTYIQFIDGDDMLLTNNYEHCLDIIRYNKADAVLFDFSLTPDAPVSYEDSEPQSGSELMRSQNIHGSVCSCLFRKAIVGRLTFTPGITYGEDEEFTPQLLLRADVAISTTAQAYYYRHHDDSATANTTNETITQRLDDNHQVIVSLHRTADTMPTEERIALQRRVDQLTMDYIYNTIVLTRSREQLDQRLAVLRSEGLFPLPKRNYTTKYKWFRRMTNSRLGLTILMRTLPLTSKER
jgi:Glycosyltransferases involved in cell wall biogenesis